MPRLCGVVHFFFNARTQKTAPCPLQSGNFHTQSHFFRRLRSAAPTVMQISRLRRFLTVPQGRYVHNRMQAERRLRWFKQQKKGCPF